MIFQVEKELEVLVPVANNILALDQSSRTTGWSVYKDNQLYTYGHFTLTDDNEGIRLHKIREKVSELIMDYDIQELVFEDIYMDGQHINNVSTFKKLAEVFGIIWELGISLEMPTEAVLPGTWRSTLGIKGRTRPEQKRAAKEYVLNTYNKKATEDECDAICIGAHYVKHKKKPDYNWA